MSIGLDKALITRVGIAEIIARRYAKVDPRFQEEAMALAEGPFMDATEMPTVGEVQSRDKWTRDRALRRLKLFMARGSAEDIQKLEGLAVGCFMDSKRDPSFVFSMLFEKGFGFDAARNLLSSRTSTGTAKDIELSQKLTRFPSES